MNRRSRTLPADDRLTYRGFVDRIDFEIIAQIRNDFTWKHYGDRMTPVSASVMENLVSTPERLRSSFSRVGLCLCGSNGRDSHALYLASSTVTLIGER